MVVMKPRPTAAREAGTTALRIEGKGDEADRKRDAFLYAYGSESQFTKTAVKAQQLENDYKAYTSDRITGHRTTDRELQHQELLGPGNYAVKLRFEMDRISKAGVRHPSRVALARHGRSCGNCFGGIAITSWRGQGWRANRVSSSKVGGKDVHFGVS